MRTPSGDLIINYDDNTSERVSGSFVQPQPSNVNENTTTYTLFPEEINHVPIITKNIYEASIPQILREEAVFNNPNKNLYITQDGSVKVVVGSNFTLAVEAVQPNTYNVENGVPTIIQRKEGITYTWFKDGTQLIMGMKIYPNREDTSSYLEVVDNKLVFTNTSTYAVGNYSCDVSNDVGSVSTEVVDLVIMNPISNSSTDFFTNLVQNSFGENGNTNWESIQGNVQSIQMLKEDGLEPLELSLKRPENNKQGFIADQFYPQPNDIDTTNIKNYDVYRISRGSGKYITREDLKYILNNGIKKVAVYQDIDLANVTDYIKGAVYGVDGVRAAFGCYLGNSISRFIPIREAVPLSNRQNKSLYFQGSPRISVENFLSGGGAEIGESLEVVLQEYYNETPLNSQIIKQEGHTLKVVEVEQVSLLDPITKKVQELKNNGKLVSQYPIDIYKIGYTLKPNDPENVILSVYKELYKDVYRYYTRGQYVEYNKAYYHKLNKSTNKFRITLVFDINDPRLFEYIWYDRSADNLADLQVFDTTNIANTFKSQPNTYDKAGTRYLVYDAMKNSTDGAIAEENGSLQDAFGLGNISSTLVTGITFSLYPISTIANSLVGLTDKQFTQNVLNTLAEDSRLDITPLKLNLKYTKQGIIYQRWKITFDLASSNFVKIRVSKYDTNTNKFIEQSNFPSFNAGARSVRYQEGSRTPEVSSLSKLTSDSITTRFGGADYKKILFQDMSDIGNNNYLPNLKLAQPEVPKQTWEYTQKLIKADMVELPNDNFDNNWNYRMIFGFDQDITVPSGTETTTQNYKWYIARDFKIKQNQTAPFIYTWTDDDHNAAPSLNIPYSDIAKTDKIYGFSGALTPRLTTAYKNPQAPTQIKNLENFVYDEDSTTLHMFEYEYLEYEYLY